MPKTYRVSFVDRLLSYFGLVRMTVRDEYLFSQLEANQKKLDRALTTAHDLYYDMVDRVADIPVEDPRIDIYASVANSAQRLIGQLK